MSSAEHFRRSEGLVSSPLGDELLIYNPLSGDVHVLNKTAHQVWKWLGDGMTCEEIANRLCASYAGLTKETADQDVRKILCSFTESTLVKTQLETPANAAVQAA